VGTCTATKRNGEPCTLPANGKQGFCWAHDPTTAEQRRRRAQKGGRAKASRELPSIKALLEDLTEQVITGDLETGRAAVANQLINTRLRAIEQERKIKETEDLEARIEALETKASLGQPMKGARQWQRRP
jgi:hypothetical protein